MSDLKVPDDAWDDDSQGAISTWFYDDGASVSAGDVVCEVMNEKVATEIVAPSSGALKILTQAEEPVGKGAVVGRVE